MGRLTQAIHATSFNMLGNVRYGTDEYSGAFRLRKNQYDAHRGYHVTNESCE